MLLIGACARPSELAWHEEEGYRMAPIRAPVGRGTGFTEMTPRKTGIGFANSLDQDAWLTNRHYVNGSGVALGDVNGDGRPDVFLAGLTGPNMLYLNRGGWRFENAAAAAQVALPDVVSTGAALADTDGDGDLDLLVTAMGRGTYLFENDGTGHFTDITDSAGLFSRGGATTMALADVDGDADLDLYVGYYKERTVKDLYPPLELEFERVVRQERDTFVIAAEFADHYRLVRQGNRLMRFEYAEPDRFYLNDGTGRFIPVDPLSGAFVLEDGQPREREPRDWALTVRFQDFNGDGAPDLYVCNDFESPDHFWIGDGLGTFQAAPAVSVRKTSQSTMSVAAGDINADGHTDIFLADMLSMQYTRRQRQHQVIPPEVAGIGDLQTRPQLMQNMLLVGRGDGTFAEMSNMAGVAASEWTWSSTLLDVDLDAYEDLLLTTGHAYDAMDGDAQMQSGARRADWRRQLLAFPDLDLKNVAFRNRGDGTFSVMPDGWGLGEQPDVSHGLALADLDLDGDLDAVANRLDSPAGIFRNNAQAPRIAVRLRGLAPNTHGVGALIQVSGDNLPPRQQEIVAGGLYLSSSEPLLTLAAQDSVTITVRWRSGLQSVIRRAPTNHIYEVYESGALAAAPGDNAGMQAALMAEAPLSMHHTETEYGDFARQPLLPRRLSQRGPAVALADLNGDGADEIIMGSGRGGSLTFALNRGDGMAPAQSLGPPVPGDHAGMVVAPGGVIMAAVANYERTPEHAGDASSMVIHTTGDSAPTEAVDLGDATPGPLVLADFNGDRQLDLFVGGHFLPGRYPQATSSRILRGRDGRFTHDDALSRPLTGIGLVSGAAAGDLDGDGDLDLALAMDWGPVRVLINDGRGALEDRTNALGLGAAAGWWNGVALGDFNRDGRLDMVATNWGRNTVYGRPARPLVAYHGDLDRNGILDVLETSYDPSLGDYGLVRDLRVLSRAIPPLLGRVRSYREFAELTAAELFGSAFPAMRKLEAATLQSTVFMNRGEYFEAVPLPPEAQRAPAFAAAVADFDGDGVEDLFLSQNFHATPSSLPRMDAGRGLLLLGDGHGNFRPLAGAASGIRVYGEQRAAAVGDLNLDGRTDLVVTQNAAATRQFLNVGGRPGLRITLRGPMGGIGAIIRLRYADGTLGPARVVSAGSGYWSQNAAAQVLGQASAPVAVRVHWPGGAVTEMPVEGGQHAMEIRYRNGS